MERESGKREGREASRGEKGVGSLAPLRTSATRVCEVGEGYSGWKGVRCQTPLRSSVVSSFEAGESSLGGKGWQENSRRSSSGYARKEIGGKKTSGCRVTWADEVGGALLKAARSVEDEQVASTPFGKNVSCKQKESFNAVHQRSNLRSSAVGDRGAVLGRGEDGAINCPKQPSITLSRGTYKEALLKKLETHSSADKPHKSNLLFTSLLAGHLST